MPHITRTDGLTATPAGWPLPSTGEPMVTSRVITKNPGADLRGYPPIFRPGQELADYVADTRLPET